MSYIMSCFKNRQLAVNLFYTSLVLFSGKGFARETKRRIKLNELSVTLVNPSYKIQSFHTKVSEFFNTQSNQKTVSDLKMELQQRHLKNEENKQWNTTAFGQMTTANNNDEKMVMKKMENMILNPFDMEFKTTTKKMFTKKKDNKSEMPIGYLIKSSRHNVQESVEESTPLNVKFKIRPEQGRAKIALEKGSLRLEADYKVGGNGKRELASVHTLSSLGLTTKIAYNVVNKQTITSVDKTITEHISTRLTQTTGVKPDNKAEVLYSLSF